MNIAIMAKGASLEKTIISSLPVGQFSKPKDAKSKMMPNKHTDVTSILTFSKANEVTAHNNSKIARIISI